MLVTTNNHLHELVHSQKTLEKKIAINENIANQTISNSPDLSIDYQISCSELSTKMSYYHRLTYWDDRLNVSYLCFLAASKTFAEIRMTILPLIQVILAPKQVNQMKVS